MAQGILETLVKWGILLLFLGVFLFAMFSPKFGLMQKVSKIALKSEALLPNEPGNEVATNSEVSQKAYDVQQRFMNEIKKEVRDECLLRYTSLDDLDNQRLEIANYNNAIQSMILEAAGNEETGWRKLSPISANGLELCSINAKLFYDKYIRKTNPNAIAFRKLSSAVLSKDEIIIGTDEHNTENIAIRYENNVCIVPFYSGMGSWFGCDASDNALDDDCIDEIQSAISRCGSSNPCKYPGSCIHASECPSNYEIDASFLCEGDLACCVP